MSVAALSIPEPVRLPSLPIHRLTVEQYHRMIQTGILTENDRVEFLQGLLITKMPHSPSHDGTISMLLRRFWSKLPSKWIVRVQSAVTLDDSEPEPDLAIVRGPEERYLAVHPAPQDIALAAEVSDTTLLYDREVKGMLYARARIPTYWIVNLIESQVEIYTHPKVGKLPAYRHRENYGIEFGVPLVIEGKEVARFAVRRLFS